MARLVAFLKGINVGGHIVTKDKLQSAFKDADFGDVTTYRQSGNVIFEARIAVEEARVRIEAALAKKLGYDVPVFIRSLDDLRRIVRSAPGQPNKPESSLLVTFLPGPPRVPLSLPMMIPKSTAKIIAVRGAEAFSETHGGGEGALPNPFLESKLQVKATTRIINVVKGIVERYK
jgi:uncharacterized protein (DUF1697 family)